MADNDNRVEMGDLTPNLEERLEKVEKGLDIMERHADALEQTEEGLNNYMKKVDREHKDSHFHSVPRPRKHVL
ncbi:hypothetical protein [Geoalkalibacter sp.]|uniref:hypothetical protein n=1 Tax=Geoalkalibacter sp. TaxID=3041440 RepID=UPI00272EB808|nr:hypothetical protein [Geoalkalibacter sp.]